VNYPMTAIQSLAKSPSSSHKIPITGTLNGKIKTKKDPRGRFGIRLSQKIANMNISPGSPPSINVQG